MKDEAKKDSNSTAVKLVEKWKIWREELKRYWPQIDKNQQMYEFSKDEAASADDMSANTTFAIIEGQISKFNESKIDIITTARGGVKVQPFEQFISSTISYQMSDPDIEALIGSFRERKEIFERDFLVKGNAVGEVTYIYKEAIINGKKEIVADNPAFKNLPLKSVIFDPSSTLIDSDEYFVEKTTTIEKLKDLEYNAKDGTGLYKNLSEVEKSLGYDSKAGTIVDAVEEQYYTGDTKIQKKVKPIHILEHWRGAFLTVIANKKVVIREVYDPFGIGRCPLLPIMNYRVEGRPYAYSELDPIYKAVRAQDRILNQSIRSVEQFLKPSVLLQPGAKVSLDAIIAIIEEGGVAYGDPKEIGQVPRTAPPQQAYLSIDTLQQVIERTARFSPYSNGVPNSKNDNTQGTMGGIIAMQEAATPNFQVKIDKLQDNLMRPMARMFLKITANLTGEDEIKFSLIGGTNPEWIKVTKGILSGHATLQDLNAVGLVKDEDVKFFETQGTPLDAVMAFDVDWIVDVRLDSASKRDKGLEVDKKMQFIQFAQKIGAQIEPNRAAAAVAYDMEIKNFNSMLMTEEEVQAKQLQIAMDAVNQNTYQGETGEGGGGEGTPGGNANSKTDRMAQSPNPEAQMATEIPTNVTPQTSTM